MNIQEITFGHEISIEDYNNLRGSVDFIRIIPKRAERALSHSLYKIIALDHGKPVGMARVVGDGGYVFFICDVASGLPVTGTGAENYRKCTWLAGRPGGRGGNHHGKPHVGDE